MYFWALTESSKLQTSFFKYFPAPYTSRNGSPPPRGFARAFSAILFMLHRSDYYFSKPQALPWVSKSTKLQPSTWALCLKIAPAHCRKPTSCFFMTGNISKAAPGRNKKLFIKTIPVQEISVWDYRSCINGKSISIWWDIYCRIAGPLILLKQCWLMQSLLHLEKCP